MLDWIKSVFFDLYNDGNVIVFSNDVNSIGVNPDWLSNQLGANFPPTYEGLKMIPIYNLQGWNVIIDSWKERGIIQ